MVGARRVWSKWGTTCSCVHDCVPFWQRHSVILCPTLHPLCTCSATENIQFSQCDHTTGVLYLGVGCCQAVVLIHFCCFLGSPHTANKLTLCFEQNSECHAFFSPYKPACIPHVVVSKCKTLLLLLRRGRPILIPTLCSAKAARATYLGGFHSWSKVILKHVVFFGIHSPHLRQLTSAACGRSVYSVYKGPLTPPFFPLHKFTAFLWFVSKKRKCHLASGERKKNNTTIYRQKLDEISFIFPRVRGSCNVGGHQNEKSMEELWREGIMKWVSGRNVEEHPCKERIILKQTLLSEV